ncbi:MAG: hypothetical protein VX640_03465 [Pseudomonadota bacterium]|nr:hypothetical protein [Pseudomonadota bacterium]
MGLTVVIIAFCLALGALAAVAAGRPGLFKSVAADLRAALGADIRAARPKRFSPKKTLFLIGPSAAHPACRLQRRLLKPAIAAFIREDVTVMEVYGDERPEQNGEPVDWLDAALLRHAMNAEEGFFLIYVDENGKTVLRSQAPMVTADILARAGLDVDAPQSGKRRKSAVLKKLRAA